MTAPYFSGPALCLYQYFSAGKNALPGAMKINILTFDLFSDIDSNPFGFPCFFVLLPVPVIQVPVCTFLCKHKKYIATI